MHTATRIVFIAALAGIVAAPARQARAQTYDAFKQYSIRHNPHGAWSYVAAGALLTTKYKQCNGITRDYCWTNGGSGFAVAADEANKTGKTIQYLDVVLPPKYLDFDPTGIANVAFQWTAPAAGNVTVSGNFLGVATNEGSHEVAVLHNGAVLVMYTMSAYQQKNTFNLPVTVAAGDTIAFTSFTGNGGGALSTGLQAKIIVK
jgi:hypothetical protein